MPLVGRGRVDGGLVVVGKARFFVRGLMVGGGVVMGFDAVACGLALGFGFVVVCGSAAFFVR